MKSEINNGKKEHGITLLALVVTIIVLLILAGITIGAITGDDGIINKAKESKRESEIAQWEERIDTAIINAENKYRDPTLEDVIDELYEEDIIDDKEKDVDRETGAITTNEPEYVIEGKLDDYLDNKERELIRKENELNLRLKKASDLSKSLDEKEAALKEKELNLKNKKIEELDNIIDNKIDEFIQTLEEYSKNTQTKFLYIDDIEPLIEDLNKLSIFFIMKK